MPISVVVPSLFSPRTVPVKSVPSAFFSVNVNGKDLSGSGVTPCGQTTVSVTVSAPGILSRCTPLLPRRTSTCVSTHCGDNAYFAVSVGFSDFSRVYWFASAVRGVPAVTYH